MVEKKRRGGTVPKTDNGRKNHPERTIDKPTPTTARQLADKTVKGKIKALGKPIETLQAFTTPWSKSDDCPTDAHELTGEQLQLIMKQKGYPNVVHLVGCYTEQAPNPGGNKEVEFHAVPQLHFFVSSEYNAKLLKKVLDGKKRSEIFFHTKWGTYCKVFFASADSDDED